MPWANQWGLSSNVLFSTSPHSPYSLHSLCHPPAKFLSLTKGTSSCGQTSQATTTVSTLCGNKIPIIKEAFIQFPKAKWLYRLNINIIITTPSINLHDHVLTQAGMNKNGAFGKELGHVGGGSSGYTTPATVDENQVNFIISSDHWDTNAGTFRMREKRLDGLVSRDVGLPARSTSRQTG